jgi:hypothetical protein
MSELIEGLKKSEQTVGQLIPVFVTKYGEIIDGKHRKQANPKWREEVLNHIETREDYLKARIAFNYRRPVKRDEIKTYIIELAEIQLSKGIPKGELAKKLAEITPYSEKTILNLLPPKYKVQEKREAGRVSARVRAERREEEARVERLPKKFKTEVECPMCHETVKLEVDCRERKVTVLT